MALREPLVSVVMPSLDQSRFIEAAIQSVLTQSYPHLELIVADGGSTDGTLDILRELAEADTRLHWSSQPDTGPASALNRALGHVRGTIVGWLNSDDLYTPGAIARSLAAFDANPDWIMVYGQGEHIDEKTVPLDCYPTQPPEGPIERFAEGCFICQPTVYFKKAMYTLLGGFDSELKAAFDLDYWMRAFSAFPGRIGFLDVLQAQSRLHENCITRRAQDVVSVESTSVVSRNLA